MRDELRGERSPGAGLIVDENRAEARFHLVGPGAADNVEHAAGRKRQNKPDRPIRIERGGGRMRAARQRGGSRRYSKKLPACQCHDHPRMRTSFDPPPWVFNSPWRLKT